MLGSDSVLFEGLLPSYKDLPSLSVLDYTNVEDNEVYQRNRLLDFASYYPERMDDETHDQNVSSTQNQIQKIVSKIGANIKNEASATLSIQSNDNKITKSGKFVGVGSDDSLMQLRKRWFREHHGLKRASSASSLECSMPPRCHEELSTSYECLFPPSKLGLQASSPLTSVDSSEDIRVEDRDMEVQQRDTTTVVYPKSKNSVGMVHGQQRSNFQSTEAPREFDFSLTTSEAAIQTVDSLEEIFLLPKLPSKIQSIDDSKHQLPAFYVSNRYFEEYGYPENRVQSVGCHGINPLEKQACREGAGQGKADMDNELEVHRSDYGLENLEECEEVSTEDEIDDQRRNYKLDGTVKDGMQNHFGSELEDKDANEYGETSSKDGTDGLHRGLDDLEITSEGKTSDKNKTHGQHHGFEDLEGIENGKTSDKNETHGQHHGFEDLEGIENGKTSDKKETQDHQHDQEQIELKEISCKDETLDRHCGIALEYQEGNEKSSDKDQTREKIRGYGSEDQGRIETSETSYEDRTNDRQNETEFGNARGKDETDYDHHQSYELENPEGIDVGKTTDEILDHADYELECHEGAERGKTSSKNETRDQPRGSGLEDGEGTENRKQSSKDETHDHDRGYGYEDLERTENGKTTSKDETLDHQHGYGLKDLEGTVYGKTSSKDETDDDNHGYKLEDLDGTEHGKSSGKDETHEDSRGYEVEDQKRTEAEEIRDLEDQEIIDLGKTSDKDKSPWSTHWL